MVLYLVIRALPAKHKIIQVVILRITKKILSKNVLFLLRANSAVFFFETSTDLRLSHRTIQATA